MKRPIKCINTQKTYESISQAERELGVYDITKNAQHKRTFVYKRNGNGEKIYLQFEYLD